MTRSSSCSAATDFEITALDRYLAAQFPGEGVISTIERVGGGQSNPTYFIELGHRRMVLRKRPAGIAPSSAHDVEREYRALAALAGGPVPVPAPIRLERDAAVLGTPFYLMARVDGSVLHDARLPGLTPDARHRIYLALATTLARLHAVDWAAAGLADLVRPGDYLTRQIARWAKVWGDDPDAADAARWLAAHNPGDAAQCIVHGDFRFSNLVVDVDAAAIAAVLDWELFTIGDPLSDLAHTVVGLWFTRNDEYGGIMECADAAGIPSLPAFVAQYREQAAGSPRLERFHIVFALFRNAGIFHGIATRAADGTAAASNAATIGALDRVYLRRALEMIAMRELDL